MLNVIKNGNAILIAFPLMGSWLAQHTLMQIHFDHAAECVPNSLELEDLFLVFMGGNGYMIDRLCRSILRKICNLNLSRKSILYMGCCGIFCMTGF